MIGAGRQLQEVLYQVLFHLLQPVAGRRILVFHKKRQEPQ